MDVDPLDVLPCEVFQIEELRVFGCYFDELGLLFENFLSLFEYAAFNPLVLDQLEFLVLPENDVIYFFGQIANQMKPLRILPFLILEEQVGEKYPILPIGGEGFGVEFRILLEDSA